MKDLGYANGWRKTPDEVRECIDKEHTRKTEKITRTLTKISCEICGYKYQVDSGD